MARKGKGLFTNKIFRSSGIIIIALITIFLFGINSLVKPQWQQPNILSLDEKEANEEVLLEINKIVRRGSSGSGGSSGGGGGGGGGGSSNPPLIEEDIDQIIDLINNGTITPPLTNETDFSEDPPIDQIIDIITNPSSLDLISRVTKIDSTGASEIIEKTISVGQLALFVEESTDKDYRTGFLEIELLLKGDPDTAYQGSGTFDILIGEISIFQTPIALTVDSTSDSSGFIIVKFDTSNLFKFSFADNIDKFIDKQVTNLTTRLLSLSITQTEQMKSFGTEADSELFSMNLSRDDTEVIIIDEQTPDIPPAYPTDSRIVITSIPVSASGIFCVIGYIPSDTNTLIGKTTGDDTDCLTDLPPQITNLQRLIDKIPSEKKLSKLLERETAKLLEIPDIPAGTAPAPEIIGLNLINKEGETVITSQGGSGTVFDELVTRNANYTMQINSPAISSELSFGKAQETQSYLCQSNVSVNYEILTYDLNFAVFYTILPNGITIGETLCNFP